MAKNDGARSSGVAAPLCGLESGRRRVGPGVIGNVNQSRPRGKGKGPRAPSAALRRAQLLAGAQEAAALGLRVIPLHWLRTDGSCSCTRGPHCPNEHPNETRGKHPIGGRWQQRATTDRDVIAKVWEKYPDANIGSVLGDGELVVDVDPRHRGDASLERLQAQLGDLPETVTTDTGGGGLHLRFRVPPGVRLRGKLPDAPGVDFLSAGKHVVLPPSRHHSGKAYVWRAELAPGEIDVAGLPTSWLDALRAPETVADDAAAHGVALAERERRARLYAATCDPAIECSGGWTTTMLVVLQIARGFDLSPEHTVDVLREWNAKNAPPWSEDEIIAKAIWARDVADHRPLGYLLPASPGADPAAAARDRIERHRERICNAKIKPQYQKVLLAMLDLMEAAATSRLAIGVRDIPVMAAGSTPAAARWMKRALADGWFVLAAESIGTEANVYELPPETSPAKVGHSQERTRGLSDSVSLLPRLRVLGAQAFHVQVESKRGLGPTFEVVANWLEAHPDSTEKEIAEGIGSDVRTVRRVLAVSIGHAPAGGRIVTDRSAARVEVRAGRDGRAHRVEVGVRRRTEGARPLPFALFTSDIEGERWRWATAALRWKLNLPDDLDEREVHARALDVIERWLGLDGVAERKIERFERERENWRELVALEADVGECAVDVEALDALVAGVCSPVTATEVVAPLPAARPPWEREAAVMLASIEEEPELAALAARHAAARRRPSRTAAGGSQLLPLKVSDTRPIAAA